MTAESIGSEIRLKDLSKKILGRRVRVPWEEPLDLTLNGVRVLVWAFGAYVAVNADRKRIESIRAILEPFVSRKGRAISEEYYIIEGDLHEDNEISVYGATDRVLVTEDFCVVKGEIDDELLKLVSFVLAQSVALSRLEREVDEIMERATDLLDTAISSIIRLGPALRELYTVMMARLQLLDDLMILEKPRAAWESPELERVYELLRDLYEIEERFESVDAKLSRLQELSQTVAGLVLAYRESLLEILILALIALELVTSFFR